MKKKSSVGAGKSGINTSQLTSKLRAAVVQLPRCSVWAKPGYCTIIFGLFSAVARAASDRRQPYAFFRKAHAT